MSEVEAAPTAAAFWPACVLAYSCSRDSPYELQL